MRRRLLAVLLVFLLLGTVFIAACGGGESVSLRYLWYDRPLTYWEAIQLARTLDKIADSLQAPPMDRTPDALQWLAVEIAPYFYYEGVTPESQIPPTKWFYYEDESNFHVIGRYYTLNGVVTLNVRFANPWSWRFSRRPFLATLVHEIGHAQGILRPGPEMEATNQLATLEVLASMTRDQNVWAFPAFVETLAEYAEDYAFSLALKEDRLDDYRYYVRERADNAFEVATFARSMDHWATRMETLKTILSYYGEKPFLFTLDALGAEDYTRCELHSLPNDSGCLELNDAAWVIQHLPELVRDYGQLTGRAPAE